MATPSIASARCLSREWGLGDRLASPTSGHRLAMLLVYMCQPSRDATVAIEEIEDPTHLWLRGGQNKPMFGAPHTNIAGALWDRQCRR